MRLTSFLRTSGIGARSGASYQIYLLILLAAMALVVSACSSTTVVSDGERARAEEPVESTSQAENDDAAADADTNDDDSSDEQGDTEDGDERGSRTTGDTDDTDRPLTPKQLEEAAGFGLGGAEQIDGLVVDCEDGSDLACDILFQLTEPGTDEEATALSCGGRSDTETIFCTDGITSADEELEFDTDSEGLDEVVSSCEDGDMTACDFLYFRSPLDSDFQDIGATCGDRVAVAVPDCRTFLAE